MRSTSMDLNHLVESGSRSNLLRDEPDEEEDEEEDEGDRKEDEEDEDTDDGYSE